MTKDPLFYITYYFLQQFQNPQKKQIVIQNENTRPDWLYEAKISLLLNKVSNKTPLSLLSFQLFV